MAEESGGHNQSSSDLPEIDLETHRQEMVEWARLNLGWDAVAACWSEWLDGGDGRRLEEGCGGEERVRGEFGTGGDLPREALEEEEQDMPGSGREM